VLDVPAGTRFAFPAAPLETHMMPGADSRAWWHIDMMALQQALGSRDLSALTEREPDGLTEARATVDRLLGELESSLHPSKWILGGFSQGAMLSLDVALRTERKPAGLVVLSGSLIAEDVWLPRMKALAGVPVFQSHGTSDPILPYSIAERLQKELTAAGVNDTFVPFRGGHEIPPPVLDGLSRFLSGALR
jgi:phospholipase/carboxylesterase